MTIILGMNSTTGGSPMEPYPPNGSGERLWKILCEVKPVTKEEYVASFDFMNVLPTKRWFDKEAARNRAAVIENIGSRRVIVLGRKVWRLFDLPEQDWFKIGVQWTLIPHPSGRNLEYNDLAYRKKAGMVLAWHMTS